VRHLRLDVLYARVRVVFFGGGVIVVEVWRTAVVSILDRKFQTEIIYRLSSGRDIVNDCLLLCSWRGARLLLK